MRAVRAASVVSSGLTTGYAPVVQPSEGDRSRIIRSTLSPAATRCNVGGSRHRPAVAVHSPPSGPGRAGRAINAPRLGAGYVVSGGGVTGPSAPVSATACSSGASARPPPHAVRSTSKATGLTDPLEGPGGVGPLPRSRRMAGAATAAAPAGAGDASSSGPRTPTPPDPLRQAAPPSHGGHRS